MAIATNKYYPIQTKLSIEHSENRIITYFENEAGSGVLQFDKYTLHKFLRERQNQHIDCGKYFESLEILQKS